MTDLNLNRSPGPTPEQTPSPSTRTSVNANVSVPVAAIISTQSTSPQRPATVTAIPPPPSELGQKVNKRIALLGKLASLPTTIFYGVASVPSTVALVVGITGLALGSNPVGWGILTAFGAIGLIYCLVKVIEHACADSELEQKSLYHSDLPFENLATLKATKIKENLQKFLLTQDLRPANSTATFRRLLQHIEKYLEKTPLEEKYKREKLQALKTELQKFESGFLGMDLNSNRLFKNASTPEELWRQVYDEIKKLE